MSNRFYKDNKRTEPDMRGEFNATMDGIFPEIAKAQTQILRKMQRAPTDAAEDPKIAKLLRGRRQIRDYYVPEQGYLVPCGCIDEVTKEADRDHFCPVCQGEGWLWDEIFIESYKRVLRSDVGLSTKEDVIEPGLTNIPLVIFYTRSSVPITKADKVVELWTDNEGQPIRPYRREAIYRIGTPIDFRSDNGRLEYWKLDCYNEQRKFLNGPEG